MTKNTKIVVIILVVLIVVFIGGVVVGSNQADSGSEINFFESTLAQDFRNRFSTKVRLDEINLNNGASPNGCQLQQKEMTVPAGANLPCQLNIAAAAEEDSDSVRTMVLHFAGGPPGATVNVKLEQPNSDKALTVNKDLAFGQKIELEVYEGAARLKIENCPEGDDEEESAVNCTINLNVAN